MNAEGARRDIDAIFRHVLDEVDPERLTRNALEFDGDAVVVAGVRHELDAGGRIVLLGVGKSSIGMACGVEVVLGNRLDSGLVVTKRGLAGQVQPHQRTEVIESSHPIPDRSSVEAGNRLLDFASGLSADDLAIVVVSGGGSSLVEAPIEGVSLEAFQQTTGALLRAGADIWTLNAVRRRISRIKAGGLARTIAPARVVNLILSDVLGNPLPVIASGLSVDVRDDDSDRIAAVRRSAVWRDLPETVRERLLMPMDVASNDSNVVQNVVIGDAALAARAAAVAAERLGYRPRIAGTLFAGEAREFARFWAQMAISASHGTSSITPPCCVIGAGEMTVTVRGDGEGGRNTEMTAAAALEIAGEQNVVIASLASDGDDGSSKSAGGIVNGESVKRLLNQSLDPGELLEQNNTRRFLEACDGLVVTGQTGTNVNDLYLALIGEP